MTEGKEFAVESVNNTTFLDDAGQVIDGVSIRVRLTDFDELRTFTLKSDDPESIRVACQEIVDKRKQIASL